MGLALYLDREHRIVLTKAGMDRLISKANRHDVINFLIESGAAEMRVLEEETEENRLARFALFLRVSPPALHGMLFEDAFAFFRADGVWAVGPATWGHA